MLQSRLHFRIHAAQSEIRAKLKADKNGSRPASVSAMEDLERVMPIDDDAGASFSIPSSEEEAKRVLQGR